MDQWKWLVITAIVLCYTSDVTHGLHCYDCFDKFDKDCVETASVEKRNLTVECNGTDEKGNNATTWCFKTYYVDPLNGDVIVDRQCAVLDSSFKAVFTIDPKEASLSPDGMPYDGFGKGGRIYFCEGNLCNHATSNLSPMSSLLTAMVVLVTAFLAK